MPYRSTVSAQGDACFRECCEPARADRTCFDVARGLQIFPSKWNKIEHRLSCHITQNWRARALTDRVAVIELIAATTTKTGLKVASALDTRTCQKGIKVTAAQMKSLNIRGGKFHAEWS